MDTITSLGSTVCEYYHRIVSLSSPDPERSVHQGSCWQYRPQSKVSHLHWFISWHKDVLFLQHITTESLSSDDDSGFNHSAISLKGQRKVINFPMAYSEVKLTGLPSGYVYVPLTSSNLTSSSNTLEWRDGKRIRVVESCEKLHTADISHESNIFLGSLRCKPKGRIEPFTIGQWHAVPICRGGQFPIYSMSLLWCYSSACTTCQPRSNSSDLCQSASVRKV